MGEAKRCSGCYDSFSGPWCDNCDQWPCICVDDEDGDTADDPPVIGLLLDGPDRKSRSVAD